MKCSWCLEDKPESEFYADKKCKNHGGRQYHCKDCIKVNRRQYYDLNRDKVIERVRKYVKNHPHYHKEQSSRNNALASAEEKYARAKINRELKAGRIIKPNQCHRCGARRKLHAHHFNGYTEENTLNVIWVCVPCHLRLHGMVKTTRRLSDVICMVK